MSARRAHIAGPPKGPRDDGGRPCIHMGQKEESQARHPKGEISRLTLNAIVAAIRPYRYMMLLIYIEILFHFVWLAASRAGLDTPGPLRRNARFIGRRAENVLDFLKTSARGACAGRDAQPPGAPLCAPLPPAAWGGIGLFGGGDGDGGGSRGPAPSGAPAPIFGSQPVFWRWGELSPLFTRGRRGRGGRRIWT